MTTPTPRQPDEAQVEAMAKMPQHEHDCDSCVFLGCEGDYDLYFHDGGDLAVLTTVIARYGPDGDYFSGLGAARAGYSVVLTEALRRAECAHLPIPEEPSP